MSRKTKTMSRKTKTWIKTKTKAKTKPKIYRRRNPIKIIFAALGIIILVAIILFLLLFFGFKKYAVYTDEGVTLEVPWLEEYRNTDSKDIVY